MQEKQKTRDEYLALQEKNRLLHEQILLGLELEAAETAKKNKDPTTSSAETDTAKGSAKTDPTETATSANETAQSNEFPTATDQQGANNSA